MGLAGGGDEGGEELVMEAFGGARFGGGRVVLFLERFRVLGILGDEEGATIRE